MKNTASLLKNTLLLACGEIIMRSVGLCFQSFLVKNAGAESMGIYGLIMSVYMVFVTLSISGIRFAVTRLAAQQIAIGVHYPRRLMKNVFAYCLFFGTVSLLTMLLISPIAAHRWISFSDALFPLRILSISLPFIPFQAAIDGYFTAKQRVLRIVVVQFFDQLIRIVIISACIYGGLDNNAHICTYLAIGALSGEACSALFMGVLYAFDVHGKGKADVSVDFRHNIIKTALPLAVSAYARTGLSSLGHILIPAGLKKSGESATTSFYVYGVIHQMAFPAIMFPAAILSALGEVLIPQLTGAQIQKKRIGISYMANRALRISFVFSCAAAGIMFFYADKISNVIYNTSESSKYIRIFAPLMIVMYCDSVTDGCLKGLGQQLHSMLLNIIEALINVVLLWLLLPHLAIVGYIITVYIKESFNFIFSMKRLSKITAIEINPIFVFSIIISAVAANYLALLLVSGSEFFALICVYLLFYFTLIYIVNGLSRNDILWLVSLIFPKSIRE